MSDVERIPLDPVDGVEVLTLMDNGCDMLLRSEEDRVRRPGFMEGRRVEAPVFENPQMPDYLVAEHGYSALVCVTKGARSRQVMFDAGLSAGGLAHNMDVLEVRLPDVEGIVMSHGHFDHVGGLSGLLNRVGERRLPMLLHPDFWLRRRVVIPNAEPFEMPVPSRRAFEGAGFQVIEGARPSLLLDGSVLITGEVARKTPFEQGFATHQAMRDGEWTADPLILDDQALIVNVKRRGLVIMTGCGHSGIVNIVRQAIALTGERRVAAVFGGFHLSGPMFEPIIPATVVALREIGVGMIVPAHCTGFVATKAISQALPDAFLQNSIGSRFFVRP
jgi:7,8-dihydropterin-6-yl-methyl-4-(beta-D-ribofuranosyl)aminobenzene 5'-phosphate synthase